MVMVPITFALEMFTAQIMNQDQEIAAKDIEDIFALSVGGLFFPLPLQLIKKFHQ